MATLSHQRLAEAYCKLLNAIDWTDEILVKGIQEGRNKFLSNAFASQFPRKHKHHKTHLISKAALEQLDFKDYHQLIYEHLVPKQEYIQKPCEELARNRELTVDFVLQLLNRYWQVATITTEENARLKRTKMPDGWDKEDIRARYKLVGIELQKNPYFDENDEPRIVEIIEQIGGGRLDQSNSQPTILP